MALSRKSLKAMGLVEEQIDTIVEAHSETVDALKEKLKAAEEKAAEFDDVKAKLDDALKNNGEDYKKKYDDVKKEFSDYKASVEKEKSDTAKREAVKAYFESKGITGANLEIAIRGARDEIEAVEMDGEKIKSTKAFDDLIAGTYKGLIVTEEQKGAAVSTPIAQTKAVTLTKEEIYKKDEHGKYVHDSAERQRMLIQNFNEERKN